MPGVENLLKLTLGHTRIVAERIDIFGEIDMPAAQEILQGNLLRQLGVRSTGDTSMRMSISIDRNMSADIMAVTCSPSSLA